MTDETNPRVEIRRAAMDLLARREHSKREIRQKLSKRFSSYPDLMEVEIDILSKEGLQSDERLAEAFIRSRASRGHGPMKIRSELRGKGVDDGEISQAFAQSDIDWFERVATVAAKRFGDQPPGDAKDRARRNRFLQQRGFSFDEIGTLY